MPLGFKYFLILRQQLIRRWCNKDDNHFYVDKYNYEFLLDYYVKKNRKDVLDDKLEELYSDIENLPPSNTLEQLKRFYDERDMKMIKKRNKLGSYIICFNIYFLSFTFKIILWSWIISDFPLMIFLLVKELLN